MTPFFRNLKKLGKIHIFHFISEKIKNEFSTRRNFGKNISQKIG